MVRSSRAAGGEFEVQVARLGERVETFMVAPGTKVSQVLDMAGVDHSTVVKVNGEAVELTDEVEANDRLIITGKVSGGVAKR